MTSAPITRLVATGTSVSFSATIKPSFVPTGALFVSVSDPSGVIAAAASVTSNPDGSFSVAMSTSPQAPLGDHSASMSLALCADTACSTKQVVPSVDVPFHINVLAASSEWPGNNQPPLVAWDSVPEWSGYQGNAAHTGYVPVQLDPNAVSTRWRISAVHSGGTGFSLPGNLVATSAGLLYVAGPNQLYTRREADASLVWTYDFSSLMFPSANPPVIANGTVYLSAGQQSSTFLFALDAVDGSVKFKSPMTSQWEWYLPPAVDAEGNVYANAGTYGGLYGFDASGMQLFFDSAGMVSMWSPALDATSIYAYTDGNLRVFDLKTGVLRQTIHDPSFQTFAYELGGSPVVGNGSVFVANYDGASGTFGNSGNYLLCFNPAQQTIAWQVQGGYRVTPAYSNGVVYAANLSPDRLEARAEADGRLLWSWTPPLAGDTGFLSEVVVTDSTVFVSTNLNTYAIDKASHAVVWSFPQPGRLSLSKNGVLYIHGDLFLTALNVK